MDDILRPASSDRLVEYYEYILPSSQVCEQDDLALLKSRCTISACLKIVLKNDLPATHAIVSDIYGTPCGHSDSYIYIENCQFNR